MLAEQKSRRGQLAELADVYVNDAFGTAHRAHASTVGVARLMRDRGAGLLVRRELESLSRLLGEIDRPFVAVLGGAKVSDKIGVIESLLDRVDALLIGGAMANTFLAAQGRPMGRSLVEKDRLPLARELLRKTEQKQIDLILPTDLMVSTAPDDGEGATRTTEVRDDFMALDIGPDSQKAYAEIIRRARTIFWNGPMGVFEKPPFDQGTLAVCRAVANASAFSAVGGGDSVAAVKRTGLSDKFSHVSTGGGASLQLIEGRELPGITALME